MDFNQENFCPCYIFYLIDQLTVDKHFQNLIFLKKYITNEAI